MFVHALETSNFRSFTAVRLDLRHPDARSPELKLANVNLILGNTGAGKSAILRAIALATLAPVISSSGLVPYRLVRRTRAHTANEARVEARVGLHGQDVGSKEHGQLSTATTATRVERIRDVER